MHCQKTIFWSASKKQTRSVWKTWNFKKWWLYNSEFIRFFISSKLIGIDLLRQTNKINFTGKLGEDDDGATMFFIVEKEQKTILNFSLDSLIVTG